MDRTKWKICKTFIRNVCLNKIEKYVNEISQENIIDDNGIDKAPVKH